MRIYAAPEDADIYDENVWRACNPSIGVTIDIENVRKEALAAKNSESAEKLFRWLRLNQWVSLKRVGWLPIILWDRTERSWTRDDMRGRRCYVGLDLSSVSDLTATASLFPPRRIGADIAWVAFHAVEGWREQLDKAVLLIHEIFPGGVQSAAHTLVVQPRQRRPGLRKRVNAATVSAAT